MKFPLLAVPFLLSLSSYAAPWPNLPIPQVKCQMMWDLRDAQGISTDVKHGKLTAVTPTTPGTDTVKEFSLKAALRLAGAGGGAAPYGYDLSIELKHGDYTAFRSDLAVPNNSRHSLALIAGKERVFVNCDITKK